MAINNHDQIVGNASIRVNASETRVHGFFWTSQEGMMDIGTLGEDGYSTVCDVNELGQVVGKDHWAGTEAPFVWDAKLGMISLGTPPGSWDIAYANGINNHGEVICGYSSVTADRSYRWDAENGLRRMPRLEGVGWPVSANAINDHGQVVGLLVGPVDAQAYLWDPATGHTLLGYLADDDATSGRDINEQGQVIGASWRACDCPDEYWIWDAGHGIRNVEGLLDPCYTGAGRVRLLEAINNLGQMVGLVDYDGVVLTPFIAADPDLDGDTDLTDLATVLANFGRTQVPSFAEGDIDEDFDVDLDDLAHVLVNFGNQCP